MNMNEFLRHKTVAFVGMAPTIVDKGLGDYIDSFDVVIRTNVFPMPERFVKDYGSKCDIISMLKTSQIKPDVFFGGGIKYVIHYPLMDEKQKDTRLQYIHMSIEKRNIIRRDIINILNQNPGHGTAGVNIVNTVLKCQPLRLMLFGVTGYQDKNGNIINHGQGVEHYIDHFKINFEKIGTLVDHRCHKLPVQNDYLKYLLKKGLIEMDQYSLEYFK